MKKGICTLFILTIIVSLCSCTTTKEQTTVETAETKVSYEKIKLDVGLKDDESMTCCYCTDTKMVLSIGKRNGAMVGPMVDTQYLMLYDYEGSKEPQQFRLNTRSYVYNAIPYKKGIVYATYDEVDKNRTRWEVNYVDKNGIKELDCGVAREYNNIPCFAEVNNSPVYVYEDIDEDGYECGVRKVKEMKVKNLFVKTDYKLCTSGILPSNGEQYVIMMEKKNSKYSTAIIGDENDIVREHLLQQKLASYSINKDYVVCSTVVDDDTFSLLSINLKDGTESYTDSGRALFRVTGGSGDTMASVDYTYQMFAISAGKKTTKKQIPLPVGKAKENVVIFYYPTSPSNYIVSFNNDEYYKMKIH